MRSAVPCALLALTAGCLDASLEGIACVDDSACGDGQVCAFGACAVTNVENLGPISLEVTPGPTTDAPRQAFFDVELEEGTRFRSELVRAVLFEGELVRGGEGVAAQIVASPDRFIAGRHIAVVGTSDANGDFAIGVAEGPGYALSVLPDDPSVPPIYTNPQLAEGGSDGRIDLGRLVIPETVFTVTGRVVVGDGASTQGVPGLDVRLVRVDRRRMSSTARTDGEGRFTLECAVVGDPLVDLRLEIRATPENELYPDVDIDDVDVVADLDLGDVSMGLVLSPVPLELRVLKESGGTAGGAEIYLTGIVSGIGTYRARATTDAQGDATVEVPPGEYTVVVVGAAGDDDAGLAVVPQEDAIAVPFTDGRFTIEIPPTARWSGNVTDELLGGNVVGATLELVRVGDDRGVPELELADTFVGYSAITADDGSFDLDVAPGTYRVTVRPALSTPAPADSLVLTVPADGLTRDVDLPDHAVVAGAITFDGLAAAGAYVRVFGQAEDERRAKLQLGEGQCGPDGKFEVVVGLPGPPE